MRIGSPLCGLVIALFPISALAQQTQPAEPAAAVPQPTEAATRLAQKITISLADRRLEDVLTFVKTATGVRIDPLWTSPQFTEGLDREAVVTIEAENLTVIEFVEKVLELVPHAAGDAPTWQLTPKGVMQIGPRSRLNRYKRLEIYDVRDILKETPNHTSAPTVDLQQALQKNGGTPLRPEQDDREDSNEKRLRKAQTLDELAELIRNLIEPEQWNENGGEGGSMRVFQGNLIVSAPDYIHRQIAAATRIKRDSAPK